MSSAEYYIIGGLLMVIGVLAWLRMRPGADAMAPEQIIHMLITAAEQMLPGYTGEQKLEWVIAQLKQFGLNLDPRLERLMIESAVYYLKQSKVQPATFVANTVQAPGSLEMAPILPLNLAIRPTSAATGASTMQAPGSIGLSTVSANLTMGNTPAAATPYSPLLR